MKDTKELVKKLEQSRKALAEVLANRDIPEPTKGNLYSKWEESIDQRGKDIFEKDPAEHIAKEFLEAGNQLVERWKQYAFKLILKNKLANPQIDPSEIASTVMLAAIKAARYYEPERGTSFSTMLSWSVQSEIRNLFRHHKRSGSFISLDEDYKGKPLITFIEDKKYKKQPEFDIRAKLIEAMGELTKKQRDVLYLYYYKGLTKSQIGTIRGYSKQNVWLRLKDIKKILKDKLTKHNRASGDSETPSFVGNGRG